MDINQFKKLIPHYLTNELQPKYLQSFKEFLQTDPAARQELEAFQKSWDLLVEFKAIEPDPGYMSRFWTSVSRQPGSWHKNIGMGFKRLVPGPVLAAACVVLIIGFFVIRDQGYIQLVHREKSQLDDNEIELVEYLGLVENYDLVTDTEFFKNVETLKKIRKKQNKQSLNYSKVQGVS